MRESDAAAKRIYTIFNQCAGGNLSPEKFVEWLRRQGYSVINVRNSYWYNQGPKVFQSIPYDHIYSFDPEELKEIFEKTGAIALRYSTGVEQPLGKISYHVVRDKPFEFFELPKKVRHDIQHGLEYAKYQSVSFEQMARVGWEIRADTLHRQGRDLAETEEHWKKLCNAANGLDGFEAWGALREGKLIACLFCAIVGSCCQILYHQSLTEHLKFGINNTLTYTLVNEMLERKGVSCVFYGLHSLDAPASVDDFKFRMGFSAKPVRQRVVFNPIIAPLINPFSHSIIRNFRLKFPGNALLAKSEGMFRFYLEGKKPLAQQSWPEILSGYKDTLLRKIS